MVAVFFGPVLFAGRVFLLGDLSSVFYPGYVFYRESIRQGALPLWNPYMGCGEPFLADLERGTFYPPNLIYVFLSTSHAVVIWTALHVLLAGAGTYGLSRGWRVSRMGSLLAGVSYAFGAYTITKVEFPSHLGGTAWFPVVLAVYAQWLRRRDRRAFFFVAGALCLQFLAGHPEMLVFTAAALLLYALFAGFSDWRSRRRWRCLFVPILGLGAAGILALLLSMAQFLPTWEALQLSSRVDVTDPRLHKASVHPLTLFTLLIPSLYGVGGNRGLYWAPSCFSPSIGAFYVGVVPMVIFLSAIIHRVAGGPVPPDRTDATQDPSRVRTPFLLALFVFFFLYAMGRYTPFYAFWRQAIPLLQQFVWPSKCLVCVVLALSCLAGVGMDRVVLSGHRDLARESRWRRFLLRWGTFLTFLVVGLFVGACLLNGGELGKAVLVRFFNLGTVNALRVPDIPWDVLSRDSLKLPVAGLVTALLLWACGSRRRAGALAAWAIVLVSFGDLLITHRYLLNPGPASVLETSPAHLGKLRPSGDPIRFLAIDHILPEGVWRSLAELTEGAKVEDLDMTDADSVGSEMPDTPIRLMRQLLCHSWPMADKAFNMFSLSNFVSRDVQQMALLCVASRAPPDLRKRALAMANCDRILYAPEMARAVVFGTLDKAHLAHLGQAMPRAYVVGGVEAFGDHETVLAALMNHPFDPWEVALVDQACAQGDAFGDLRPARVEHEIKQLRYGQNRLEIDLHSASSGMLVVSDTYYPGWHATVNGQEVPILRANGLFRGVRVPAGDSTVTMVYRPTSLTVGIAISLGTLVVIAIFLIPRRSARPAQSS